MYVSMFIFIFFMAGQTAGPNVLKFSELTHQGSGINVKVNKFTNNLSNT